MEIWGLGFDLLGLRWGLGICIVIINLGDFSRGLEIYV